MQYKTCHYTSWNDKENNITLWVLIKHKDVRTLSQTTRKQNNTSDNKAFPGIKAPLKMYEMNLIYYDT